MRRVLRSARDKLVDVRPAELRAVAFAFVFNFVVLASYYVARPIRDEIGAAGGLENLSWMYTGTLVTMLAANALFSKLVAHFSRRRFIPIAYRFFIANLILFYFAMRWLPTTQQVWVGRAFFVVTVFWAFMTDVFNTEQAKRLFGFISVGGTLGAIFGAVITAALVKYVGTMNLLFASALLLEIAAQCVRHFPFGVRRNRAGESDRGARDEAPIGGGIWTGMTHAIRSSYLLGMCGFLLLYTITSTVMYFQQADITAHHFHDRAARTAFFAQLDLSVNVLTVLIQMFLTGRLLKRLGVGVTLALLPAISAIGFVAVACAPGLGLLAIFQTLRRASNYALSRPAREVLFTVLTREDKYKAKSFIDTFIYRAGDQIGAWSYPALTWLGLGIIGISWVAVPLAGVWCLLSLWLGRRQVEIAAHADRR